MNKVVADIAKSQIDLNDLEENKLYKFKFSSGCKGIGFVKRHPDYFTIVINSVAYVVDKEGFQLNFHYEKTLGFVTKIKRVKNEIYSW